ncbi:MAG: hypothetical protein HS117_04415 [Verrucomicrobiaceae bacterium]|jgi:hypothetical protein|nr:hypothetical protein [Verrucomicrobiaceae bacterium]
MPACQIDEYHDSQLLREELVAWSANDVIWPLPASMWERRLRHWWDENPFAAISPLRGWIMRHEGRVTGFMALIPACYAVQGECRAAYAASTWRVDEAHRNASLSMLMKMRRLAATTLLVDTTPTPDVQVMLQKSGWTPATSITRRFVPLGLAGLPWRGKWPRLSAGQKITRDPAEVRFIAASFQKPDRIEKWVTLEYLRWFAASPMRRHEFIGAIDSVGCLTSYLFVTPKAIRGIPGWMEIDHFTTRGDSSELHALVGEIARDPALLGREHLLSLASFPGDSSWDTAPVLHRREEQVTHHFSIPAALKTISKHSVLAEGDWGL